MRYGVAIPQANQFAAPEALRAIARAVEDIGFDSIWVSDHVIVPEGSSYIPEFMTEPLAVLAYLTAETRHVTIGTSVLIVPYRDPVFTAKFLSSVDYLSSGRLVVGTGAGWLAPEFEALGVPFEDRGRRTEEYLAVAKALWAGGEARFAGRTYRLPPVRTGPLPVQRPHPPLWIAGNSPRAVRRAARLGDGWHAIDLGPEELAPAVARLRAEAVAAGRDPDTLTVSLRKGVLPGGADPRPLYGDPDKIRRDLEAYAHAGVGYVVASLRRAASAEDAERALEAAASALTDR